MTTPKANNLEFIRLLLAKIKEKHGLRQYQIAKRLKTKPSVISKWMNENTKPYDNSIYEVAKEFDIEIVKHRNGLFYLKEEEPVDQTNESPGMYEVKPMRILLERLRDIADQIDHKDYSEEIKDIVFEIYSIHNYTYEELLKAQNQILTKMLNSQRTSNQNK